MCGSKIEGSQATAKLTAELLRSVISQQRVPYSNQAGALIDAVKAVGEQLIAANPVGIVASFTASFIFGLWVLACLESKNTS